MRLKIVENREIAKNTFILKVENPALFEVLPGQFFMIKINEFNYPLLRRPFSVAGFSDTIDFIYRVVGEGTAILSKKKAGEFMDFLGPLGNGFKINSTRRLILVGGGVGVAPLIYLKDVIESKYKINCETYFGFNSIDEVFTKSGFIATVDGSYGFKGTAVDMVQDKLDEDSLIFACGPVPMMKKLALLSFEYGCSMQVSLESRMACGIGVCLGCVVETVNGDFKRVCVDGPVFDFEEIEWQEM